MCFTLSVCNIVNVLLHLPGLSWKIEFCPNVILLSSLNKCKMKNEMYQESIIGLEWTEGLRMWQARPLCSSDPGPGCSGLGYLTDGLWWCFQEIRPMPIYSMFTV